MKKLTVAANWKLYLDDVSEIKTLISGVKRKAALYARMDVVLLPPAPLLAQTSVMAKSAGMAVGAQSISPFGEGAHTGYLSAQLVKNAGCSWVLVGHSEQRAQTIDGVPAAGVGDEAVAAQVRAANEAGLKVLLCVGERERDPTGAHFGDIEQQLRSALLSYPKTGTKLTVAYEPVWAIGKSAAGACTPADLEEMVIFIRRTLTELFDRGIAAKIPILYGGSVDATNAHELLVQGGVSGFLVGRASTDAKTFIELLEAIQ